MFDERFESRSRMQNLVAFMRVGSEYNLTKPGNHLQREKAAHDALYKAQKIFTSSWQSSPQTTSPTWNKQKQRRNWAISPALPPLLTI